MFSSFDASGILKLTLTNEKTGQVVYEKDVVITSVTHQISAYDPRVVEITMVARELIPVVTFAPIQITIGGECKHDWTGYHGLNEQFEYCKNCNERKS